MNALIRSYAAAADALARAVHSPRPYPHTAIVSVRVGTVTLRCKLGVREASDQASAQAVLDMLQEHALVGTYEQLFPLREMLETSMELLPHEDSPELEQSVDEMRNSPEYREWETR